MIYFLWCSRKVDMAEEFSIVLLRPEIPHNTGAIGRLCVGLGVKLNLVRPLGFGSSSRAARKPFAISDQH